ncbi:ribonucleotide reductase of class Ia (aerobic), alpha subunit [Tenacibaculum phage Larrie]|nr:ribonucleotide reductase of class Ia (aerobic), alpha subunit [Tenacibaculum phage Larrie]
MIVTKRNGEQEVMQFDKIVKRIDSVMFGIDKSIIDSQELAMKVINGLYDGVSTSEIDELIAQTSASMATIHPDYTQLAGNISVSNLHKNTSEKGFVDKMVDLYHYIKPKNNKHSPIVSAEAMQIALDNRFAIEEAIDYSKDYSYDFFGFKTLEKSYLLKIDGKIVERPQDMLMRVSIGIHGENIDKVLRTYRLMSEKYFTHATPTLFNAGTPRPQLSSCFLLDMKDDSIEGIYDTLKVTAKISKDAGGIGVAAHKVRATGSFISGTNGTSNGIVPMLKVFNETARYVDQGGGKRKGSFAMYLEPWHADIFDFLDLKKNHGKEEMRARDLFYALWINDEFMRRVQSDQSWYLMSPDICTDLVDLYGKEFDKKYNEYIEDGKFVRKVKARELWEKIIVSQIETGTPYMTYKDAANLKSNQSNLGTIKSSNLCAEIMEYTSPEEVAVCNLASIALPKFVVNKGNGLVFDFEKLREIAYIVTNNLNDVIDRNYYPVDEARNSNQKHRPIGLGVQGLADVFMLLKIPFESDEAKELNEKIFENIYYASLNSSCDSAAIHGAYRTFYDSPLASGIFQFDFWGEGQKVVETSELDWEWLKNKISIHGVRNSLNIALMPTASTGQILGNNEAFEPYTNNIYIRRTLSGEFIVVNKHLIKDLIDLGLWNNDMREDLMRNNGSVQRLNIPQNLKDIYKTAFEMSMKNIIDMSADRGKFVCQSQSLNLFMNEPTYSKLTSMHFYAWRRGLKTGMYYLRTKAAANAKQFTLSVEDSKTKDKLSESKEDNSSPMSTESYKEMIRRAKEASMSETEDCLMCGS